LLYVIILGTLLIAPLLPKAEVKKEEYLLQKKMSRAEPAQRKPMPLK
jgi:hypothetical protein